MPVMILLLFLCNVFNVCGSPDVSGRLKRLDSHVIHNLD